MDGQLNERREVNINDIRKAIFDLANRAQETGKDRFIADLHEEKPLFKNDYGFWVASKFEDIRTILMDPKRYSSSMTLTDADGDFFSGSIPLVSDDPPRHSILRSLLAKAFTPAAMEAMRPDIERLATELAADIPYGEEVDVVAKITSPLPVAVIASMMGVPRERGMDFKRWSDALTEAQNIADADRLTMLKQLYDYFGQLSAERRATPGNDLISAMTKVNDTRETLSDKQIVNLCILLMFAGNETTTNLLGNLLDRVADEPETWTAMRNDPALVEGAIEESLRIDSPAQTIRRVVTEDVTISGQDVKAGDIVMLYLASANRDPAKWEDPANFEVARIRERHLAFGHGIHICIGAPLARMEAKAALNALVARFETISHGAQPGKRITGSGTLFGFKSLPIVFG